MIARIVVCSLIHCYSGDIVKMILLGVSSHYKYHVAQPQSYIHNYSCKGKGRIRKERELEIIAAILISQQALQVV